MNKCLLILIINQNDSRVTDQTFDGLINNIVIHIEL